MYKMSTLLWRMSERIAAHQAGAAWPTDQSVIPNAIKQIRAEIAIDAEAPSYEYAPIEAQLKIVEKRFNQANPVDEVA